MAKGTSSINAGPGSLSAIGDNVTLTLIKHESFRRSYLYDVCQAIRQANVQINDNDDFSLKLPSGWIEKLEYNSVKIYAELFGQEIHAIDQIESVMKEFPNRVELVNKVRHLYLLAEKERTALSEDGDFVLEIVFKQLSEIVDESKRPVELQMPVEEKDRYIKLVMFYVFTKCQLLKRVGE